MLYKWVLDKTYLTASLAKPCKASCLHLFSFQYFRVMSVVFSACDGIRSVFTAYFPWLRACASWERVDCSVFVAPPLHRRLPYTGLTDSSTRAETGCTGCTDLQLIGSSVADCQALTWPFRVSTCSIRVRTIRSDQEIFIITFEQFDTHPQPPIFKSFSWCFSKHLLVTTKCTRSLTAQFLPASQVVLRSLQVTLLLSSL